MVSGRPLLYLSLPGVAFILGVFWFRRRNKNRLDKPDDEDNNAKESSGGVVSPLEARTANGSLQNGKLPTSFLLQQATKSMNINGTGATENGNGSGSGSGSDEKDSPNTMLYGKSAPIKIQSNGRTPPGVHQQQQQQQIDSEMLKSKIQDAEHKKLCSIDEDFENLSSPRDLPDSVNTRVSFYNRKANSKVVEPVVIKATRTPKISPENSFLEATYTKECEQNNNCQPGDSKKVAVEEEPPNPSPIPRRLLVLETKTVIHRQTSRRQIAMVTRSAMWMRPVPRLAFAAFSLGTLARAPACPARRRHVSRSATSLSSPSA
ncbi:uncharacterized protein LOC111074373 isoform X1 [Drosophila obscura]|uniref:uncharacterized protein LOC111074373 isoform X1 n=1 Tax=Drosophila obscura TaxID=7282 RepID=UPI001BB23108|nr:uncharacterized protein LOC111074373 isoform X1 [Drosophila obscura]XP_022222820.2 uncharacterized protein LOC111074373 isoform X1 [Drosophila obscura]